MVEYYYTKARGIEFDPFLPRRNFFLVYPTKIITETALMAPPPTEGQKIEYLTHLQYVHSAEAARRARININTAKKIRARVSAFLVECEEASLPTPTIEEQVARKPRLGAKP